MDQPSRGLIKRIAFALLILLTLSGCRLVSSLKALVPTPTPTPTLTPEYCAWTWAYGDGSTEFDSSVTEKLAGDGISATVISSSYGEVYSCDHSFHPMALDVRAEIKVDILADQDLLASTSDKVLSLIRDNRPISNVNNLGNVSLTFITPDGNTCYWKVEQKKCAE